MVFLETIFAMQNRFVGDFFVAWWWCAAGEGRQEQLLKFFYSLKSFCKWFLGVELLFCLAFPICKSFQPSSGEYYLKLNRGTERKGANIFGFIFQESYHNKNCHLLWTVKLTSWNIKSNLNHIQTQKNGIILILIIFP